MHRRSVLKASAAGLAALAAPGIACVQAADEAGRRAICRDIQLQAWQDMPYIPTRRWKGVTAYRDTLSGMLKGMPIFYNLRKA